MTISNIIRHRDEIDLFWNNETDWGDFASATFFTDEERETLTAPLGGVWHTYVG